MAYSNIFKMKEINVITMNKKTKPLKDPNLIPNLMHLEARFSQEGNTLGTTEEYEQIIIKAEYRLPPSSGEEDQCFFTIHSADGWSVDNPEEMAVLIESVKQAAIKIGEIKSK